MKFSLIFLSGLVLANAIPTAQRLRRDVNELRNQYLVEVEVPQESLLTKKNQDKTMCKLCNRNRRDVSHLNLEYLPAVEDKEYKSSKQLPTLSPNEYLPPFVNFRPQQIVTETPQSVTTMTTVEATVSTESVQFQNDYLPPPTEVLPPPVEYLVHAPEVVTKLPQLASNVYLPVVNTDEGLSELPLEPFSEIKDDKEITTKDDALPPCPEKSSVVIVEAPVETLQDSAVLEIDGYHYKIPENKPNLFPSIAPTAEHLPSLEDDVVAAVEPTNGDSVILEKDGYYYRSIKRSF